MQGQRARARPRRCSSFAPPIRFADVRCCAASSAVAGADRIQWPTVRRRQAALYRRSRRRVMKSTPTTSALPQDKHPASPAGPGSSRVATSISSMKAQRRRADQRGRAAAVAAIASSKRRQRTAAWACSAGQRRLMRARSRMLFDAAMINGDYPASRASRQPVGRSPRSADRDVRGRAADHRIRAVRRGDAGTGPAHPRLSIGMLAQRAPASSPRGCSTARSASRCGRQRWGWLRAGTASIELRRR